MRTWFAAADFIEVETPALQVSPGLEPHLHPFATELVEPFDASRRTLYLHTSPEFAMKKLLVGGMPRIFQMARAFRNGERSELHHPEFTMLEWYRAGADYRTLMADCESLVRAACAAAATPALSRHGRACDPFAPWRRLSVAEAFAKYAGIDLLATVADPEEADPDPAALKEQARAIGIAPGEGDRWEDVFFRIMLDRIEPHLGMPAPTILYDYPAALAALARRKADDPRLAERFELYAAGVELANAYSELTDAAEQRRRFRHDAAVKARLYGQAVPVDEDFLAALDRGLPASAGIALGFDRLAMLASGAPSITDVLWAPVA